MRCRLRSATPRLTIVTCNAESFAAASSNAFNAFSKSCWFMYATPMLLRRAGSWVLVEGTGAASSAMNSERRKVGGRAMLSFLVHWDLGKILSEWLARGREVEPSAAD